MRATSLAGMQALKNGQQPNGVLLRRPLPSPTHTTYACTHPYTFASPAHSSTHPRLQHAPSYPQHAQHTRAKHKMLTCARSVRQRDCSESS